MNNTPHPAKYTSSFLPVFASMLKGDESLLDPFAGTGKIHSLLDFHPNLKIQAIEIEPEWARIDARTILGNALCLPFKDSSFDAICVSPTYGNRMADRDKRSWKYVKTYSTALGRMLNKNNSGSMQWGDSYREFHIKAWTECKRVLRNNGTFILNIKNHIRNGQEQLVTEWHVSTLTSINFSVMEHIKVQVPSMRKGTNSEKRIPYESIIRLILSK